MLFIQPYNREQNHRILFHGADVFHKALKWVLRGETVFHVVNPDGENYNLKYISNQAWAEGSADYPDSPLFHREPLCPPYLVYDEADRESLCYDVLEGFSAVYMEEANEYTIVLAGLILRDTNLRIIALDERFRWFFAGEERLSFAGKHTCTMDNVLMVRKDYYPSGLNYDFGNMDPVTLFHHIFLCQWLTDLPFSQVKYVEITVARSEGIGSILTVHARAKDFFRRFGWEVTLQPDSARYSNDLLRRYFNVRFTPEDANEQNTVYVTNYYSILFTKMLFFYNGHNDFDRGSLSSRFLGELQEYGDTVLQDKKWLGILMRGSDYIASGMSGTSTPVTMEAALPKIREWMKDGNYDGIFLATEDKDILRKMFAEFPGKIRAVAQERYTVTDFEREGVITISELDCKRHPGEEYDRFIEDSTVNYFYALYLLSCCESFMYSCDCGGITLVRSLNEKGFHHIWSFSENMEMKWCRRKFDA